MHGFFIVLIWAKRENYKVSSRREYGANKKRKETLKIYRCGPVQFTIYTGLNRPLFSDVLIRACFFFLLALIKCYSLELFKTRRVSFRAKRWPATLRKIQLQRHMFSWVGNGLQNLRNAISKNYYLLFGTRFGTRVPYFEVSCAKGSL